MTDALLRVDHLTTVFETPHGEVRAVDDVTFEVQRGETLALVGESGSGKSVTALSVMRLIEPPGFIRSGTVSFEGRNLLALSEREMRQVRGARLSLVFQEPVAALNPVFTIGDQVAEALVVHRQATGRQARRRAVELLETVRIPDPAAVAGAYPHQLSGGMRQRVLIAMALACRPALVIADEPTTALDVTIQAEILDLLRDMKAQYQLSLLLITHDLAVVAETVERVLVMYAGRIVETSPVRGVFEAAAHPYTRALVGSVAGRTEGRHLPAIDGAVPDLSALPPGCAFAPRCANRTRQCDLEAPRERVLGPDHTARCHLYFPAGPEEAAPACAAGEAPGPPRANLPSAERGSR